MKTLDVIALTLLIIGGLNWGLVGLFNYDVVTSLFGAGTMATKIVYAIVGVAGLYSLYLYWPILRGEDRRIRGDTGTHARSM